MCATRGAASASRLAAGGMQAVGMLLSPSRGKSQPRLNAFCQPPSCTAVKRRALRRNSLVTPQV
jgi:hypothetical protein